jgi:hypothetical protein
VRSALFASSAFAVVALAVACSDSGTRECRVGADCVSGMCTAEGTCAAPAGGSSGTTSSGDSGPGPIDPSGDDGGGSSSGDASLPGCTPNKDGVIARSEVPIQAGLRATFRVAEDVDVDTAGTPGANGTRSWDFSGALANDANVIIETMALTNKWYAPKYSGATYASKLRSSSDLIGVFETAPATLALRGVVSPDDGAFRTELAYDPSVSVLSFPLKVDDTWTSDTSVSGVAEGYPVAYTEKYESVVDAKGTLKTPLGTFDVLRVRVLLTRTIGLVTTKVRTFAFVTECYGTIATITSEDNEGDVEFTHALEIRRIAP